MGEFHDPGHHDDEAPLRGWLGRDDAAPTGAQPAVEPTATHEAQPQAAGAGGQPTSRRTPLARRVLAGTAIVVAIALGAALSHVVWPSVRTQRIASSFPTPQFDFPGGSGSFPNFQFPSFQFPQGGSSGQSSGGPANADAIAAKVSPGLVDVNGTFSYQNSAGEGTGIVLTSSGEILTNNHVIAGATSISVRDVGNGRTYSATVVGYDRTKDVAVLQLAGASGLTTAPIGDSSSASVGDKVLAIGNAGGVGGTPSVAGGAISGLDQSVNASDSLTATVEHLSGMIGVTAAVQPGDSGGALVSASGKVIGMNTAGSSGTYASAQTAQTTGFAIPINDALAIASSIVSGQASSTIHVGATPFLGVMLRSAANGSGARIVRVVPGGAAAAGGLVAGETITSLDGQAVTSPDEVATILTPLSPGTTIEVSGTTSSGTSFSHRVTLASGPPA